MYADLMAIKIKDWVRKRIRKKAPAGGTVTPGQSSPFQAVAVSPGLTSGCSGVKALKGRRFLVRNAPELPLPGCGLSSCQCRYVKYDDRRQEPRRDSEYGIGSTFVRDVERRAKRRGRRSTDT